MDKGGGMPFFPPLEPEEAEEARENAAKRIMETTRKAWELMFKKLCGLHEMPPRQRLALYLALEQREAEAGSDFGILLSILERVWAEEALWIAKDYQHLRKSALASPARTNGRVATYA